LVSRSVDTKVAKLGYSWASIVAAVKENEKEKRKELSKVAMRVEMLELKLAGL
jgi:hypothetical protein